MKPETIKAIFTNLLFVIGVILLIWGVAKAASTGARIISFDKYPLQGYEESRCEYVAGLSAPVMEKGIVAPSEADQQLQKKECLNSIEKQRALQKVDDIVQSIVLPFSGLTLVYFFRRYILK
jgi:hypothetical protein